MTLGHLWEIDLKNHESAVREVLAIAQGEMALEEFLKQVYYYTIAVLCAFSEVHNRYSIYMIYY